MSDCEVEDDVSLTSCAQILSCDDDAGGIGERARARNADMLGSLEDLLEDNVTNLCFF